MRKQVVEKLEFPRQSRATNKYFPNWVCTSKWINGLVSADITGDGLLYFETTKTILNEDFLKFKTDFSFFLKIQQREQLKCNIRSFSIIVGVKVQHYFSCASRDDRMT
jgi:hypothetical protein